MRLLIIGSGGREHALAWKAAQSPRVEHVYVAPGNGGTDGLVRPGQGTPVCSNVAVGEDIPTLVAFAADGGVDLTVVGPEVPLALGVVDAFRQAGLAVFGPTAAAARLETSKAFAKDFMLRHGIPTARSRTFSEYETALEYVRTFTGGVVVKASGLAAGKGVIVADDAAGAEAALNDIMLHRAFGAAGDLVIVEERLQGPEVSLLAFTDGITVAPMPPAQDHKRLRDGDVGPNTGGMGAYAPAAILDAEVARWCVKHVLQATVDGMRREGIPYQGVLYAGLMLTEDGPRVLEFNARFGDPETQVILPLLESVLVDVLEACALGRLAGQEVRWRTGMSAACVVMASGGYPGAYQRGLTVTGLDEAGSIPDVTVFHAGTRQDGAQIVTNGGRVLAVTGTGADISLALRSAYAGIHRIHFEGMQFREDIGWRAL
jgi:phosphoribosylamine---glycine ligase